MGSSCVLPAGVGEASSRNNGAGFSRCAMYHDGVGRCVAIRRCYVRKAPPFRGKRGRGEGKRKKKKRRKEEEKKKRRKITAHFSRRRFFSSLLFSSLFFSFCSINPAVKFALNSPFQWKCFLPLAVSLLINRYPLEARKHV